MDQRVCLFPVLRTEGGSEAVSVSVPLLQTSEELHAFCSRVGVHPSRIFQLAWSIVLQAYTGLDQPCFHSQDGDKIGVCCVDLSEDLPVSELLRRLEPWNLSTTTEAHSNTTLLFGKGNHSCGTDVCARVDLHDGTIHLSSQTLLSTNQALQVLDALVFVTDRITKVSQLNSIDCCSPQSILQLTKWNNDEPEIVEESIHCSILRHCRRCPEAPAICAWDGDFTYGEVEVLSRDIALRLIILGVGAEVFVGIYFEKSKWTPVLTLAILRAGGAFVFLDPSFPEQRLRQMCQQSDVHTVITSDHLSDRAAQLGPRVFPINESLLDSPTRGDLIDDYPNAAAYISFTSGSTGTPKGAVVNHHSFVSGQRAILEFFKLGPQHRVLQFAAHAFDMVIWEHLAPLMVGACICIPSEEARRSDLAQAARQLRANFFSLTPTVARFLRPSDVPELDTLILIGEPPSSSDVTTWAGHCRLLNGYGPGECSVFTSAHDFIPGDEDHPTIIGRGFGARCWVTDPANVDRLQPIGAVGELVIEGPIVGRGYVNDEVKTRASFIESPSWRERLPGTPAGKMYRTGDLVQYVSGGELRCLGRNDAQAKLRGQRLEMGEVEQGLHRVFKEAQVTLAEIVVPKDADGARTLVGFVLLSYGDVESDGIFRQPRAEFQSMAQASLRELKETLPSYMVPSFIVELATSPATKTGKADRRRLRIEAEKLTRAELESFTREAADKKLPTSPMEHALLRLVRGVLRVEAGMNDNFFHLGGDSLLAMELTRLAREEGLELTAQAVFKHSTLADLAAGMSTLTDGHVDIHDIPAFSLLSDRDIILQQVSTACGLSSEDIEDIYPCTSLQEAMMASSMVRDGATYVVRTVYRLPRAIDSSRLQQAWDAVILNSPALRTRVVQLSVDQALQVVVRRGVTLKHFSTLQEAIAEDSRQIMRLGQPLLRLKLVEGDGARFLVHTIHHAICDGWSLRQTLANVEAAYYGETPPSLPFNRFIRYHMQLNEGEMKDFWRTRLDGFSGTHFPSLPSNNYRPTNIQTGEQSLPRIQLPDRLQTTLATVLQLSWALTLSQYGGSDDVVFGSTVSGRNVPVPGIGDILGPTLATIPLRVALPRDGNVRVLLRMVREQNAQSIPFEHLGLQRIASVGAGAAAACRFQSLLIIQPRETEDASTIFGNKVKEAGLEVVGDYLITLEATLSDGSVHLVAEHDGDLIPTSLMTRMLSQFARNVEQATKDLEQTVSDLGQVNASDLHLTHQWNNHVPEAINCCIHDFLARRALSLPDAPAVDAWDGTLTYAELENLGNSLAAQVHHAATKPGHYILIHAGKSKWTVVALLAVLKAGAAFVLVDPAQPLSRLKQICSDTRANLVIASKQYWSRASDLGLEMLRVGTDAAIDERLFKEPIVGPNDTAYAVFTSGSTGRPKGVQIQHRAFLTSAIINGGKQHINHESRVIQLASFTFDSAIAEILYTLVHGGCVCIPSELESRNNLEKTMNDYKATWATLTPSLARALNPSKLTTLKNLALGGEAVTKVDVDMWADRLQLGNGYGPSESSVDAVVQPVVRPGCDPSNIGRSYAGASWIVDPLDHERLVPVGAVGELLLEGPTLALGYLNDPEKTSAAFVSAPRWLAELGRGGRLYKTGDLVQYDPTMDGSIRYLGRKDNQVKIRGQRIELAEVEHHLQECIPRTKAIIAEVVTPSDGAEPLLAAFVLLEDAPPSESILTAAESPAWAAVESAELLLRDRVPNYMIPALFLPLSRVPVNANGKTDRRLLKNEVSRRTRKDLRSFTASSSSRPKRSAQTEEEVALCQSLSKVMKTPVSELGMEDSFFHIGGDSIIAMKLVALLRESEFAVSVADIFTNPRLADLARLLVRTSATESLPVSPFSLIRARDASIVTAAEQCGVDAALIEDIYPATPMQEGLLASSLKREGAYVADLRLTVGKGVDVDRLVKAWNAVHQANAILRTRFILGPEDQVLQVVLRDEPWWSSTEDCASLDVNYGQRLIKLRLTQQGDIQLQIHHALYDGASLSYLFEQVAAAYRGESLRPSLFSGFVESASKLSRNQHSKFWQDEFRDADIAMFPTQQRPKPSQLPRQTATETFPLADISDSNFTLPTIIYLASAVVFGHYTMSHDVVYGLTLAGRSDIDTANVGPTVTTVPFRVTIDAEKSVSDNLAEVRDHLLRVGPYEQTGLQNISAISADTAAACDFNCHVVVQPAEETRTDMPFSETQTQDQYANFASYPLVLIYDLSADRKSIRMTANADPLYMIEKDLTRLLHQLHHVVHQMMQDHSVPLSDVEVISPNDIADIGRLNHIVPAGVDRLLHEIVFEQCELHPDKTAISSWDGSFTYAALRGSSAKFAAHLTASAVAPHDIVVVCMEKSCWTIVAILAVLEAGCACAVVDSSHPPERIQEIINQTGSKHAIVSPATQHIITTVSKTVVSPESIESMATLAPGRRTHVSPRDPALVFFTSGSTGKPKGMVLEHRAIATSLQHLQDRLYRMEDLRVLHFVSYAFDIAMLEVFYALTNGGCLCIPSENDRTTGLVEFIQREQVNFAAIAASAARLFRHPSEVPSLKMLMVGGEPLAPSDVALWSRSLRLIHGYAPAECSFVCAGSELSGAQWTPGTIGPAVTSCCWVADPSDPEKLVAWGAVGELLVEGHVLARGYLDQKQTNASFIPGPVWLTGVRGTTDTRLYRTGDLVHYTPEGEIRFVGRKDSQVKLRGQRIELGEVESQIKGLLPAGGAVVAGVVTNKKGIQQLFAFIHLVDGSSAERSQDFPVFIESSSTDSFGDLCRRLTSRLSAALPRYMVPDEYLQLNYIPETGTGKIDRRRLVKLASTAVAKKNALADRSRQPPSTCAEKALAELWAQELGCASEELSSSDNFFYVGGDSIHAMKLAAAARKHGMHLTVPDIFSSPLLKDMALVSSSATNGMKEAVQEVSPFSLLDQPTRATVVTAAAQQCGVAVGLVEDIYPCTPFQEGLISQSVRRGAGSFVGSFRFRLPSIDLQRFQEAWRATAQANPILRTRFIQSGSALLQAVIGGTCDLKVVSESENSPSSSGSLGFGQELVHPSILDIDSGYDFLLVVHHALYDAWSLDLILDQVASAYQALPTSPLSPYKRFVHHVRQQTESSKKYWTDQLAGSPGIKFPRLSSNNYEPVTDSVVQSQVQLKPAHGVTGAVILELAWALVLSQLTDTNDVVFGLILSGRNADINGIESIVGPSVTTVPMRFKLDRDQSLSAELRRLQTQLSETVSHEQFGLRNIKALGGDAEAACSFQNLLLIQPATTATKRGHLWENAVEQPRNAGDFSTYALEVTCETSESGASITIDFDSSVLEARQTQRILNQYVHAIDRIQASGDLCVSQLDLLDESSRQEIMDWNAILPERVNRCVHDGIADKCAKTPDAQAVCAWDGDFTYREIDELSFKLAIRLQKMGVGPEVFVPVLAEKSRWVAIAVLGVVRAGGAIILLDPGVPFERLKTICLTVGAEMIVANSHSCMEMAQKLVSKVVDIRDLPSNQMNGVTDIVPSVTPQNALYAIFTSGSTGKPKGIVTEHAAFYTSGIEQQRPLRINAETRTLQFASHMFDVSVADYLWTFLAGGCVCVPSNDMLKDDLKGAINRLGVNRADLTPSVARVLKPEDIPTVKTILLGGEPMSQHDIDTWAGKVELVNGYGPSECSVCCVLADVDLGSDPSNIGHAYGIAPWIVDKDDHDRLVPIGGIGELVLEGPSLARGYLGDAGKATASFLREAPLWLGDLRPQSRLYKTGDLVQYNSDGTIRYIGRKDTQVKIRGQRVELGEIEQQIRQSRASFRDVVVELLSVGSQSTDKLLAAFAYAEQPQRSTAIPALFSAASPQTREEFKAVVSELQTILPSYMVPALFIPLNFLPLSPTGKADRRRLVEEAKALSLTEIEGYKPALVEKRPPSTAGERQLRDVVAEVLRRDPKDIGMDDDFFRLGGDSIVALHFVERARQAGFSFRVTTVFKTPKLSELALYMSETANGHTNGHTNGHIDGHINGHEPNPFKKFGLPSKAEMSKLRQWPSKISDILPVSQSTERYLLVPPEYWIVNFEGPVDLGRLGSACVSLVQRHGVLRSVFSKHEGQYCQIVLEVMNADIMVHDTSLAVFDFVEGHRRNDKIPVPSLDVPITQFMFVRNDTGEQALVVRLSHAQFDGYCLHTLWNDLKALYEGTELPPPTNYADHMKHWAVSQTEQAFAYWQSTLQGSNIVKIDNTAFLKGHANGTLTNGTKRSRGAFVSVTTCAKFQANSSHEVTMATVVKTAWACTLAQLTGHKDVVFTQAINGRSTADVSKNVVGLCLNFSPVRVQLESPQTGLNLMMTVQQQHQESLEYELLDFRDIAKQSTPWADGTTHQSMLVHQNIEPDLPFDFGEARAHVTCSYHWEHPPDDILIESKPLGDGNGLQLTLDTTTGTLSQENAERVLSELRKWVEALVESPEEAVTEGFV